MCFHRERFSLPKEQSFGLRKRTGLIGSNSVREDGSPQLSIPINFAGVRSRQTGKEEKHNAREQKQLRMMKRVVKIKGGKMGGRVLKVLVMDDRHKK